MSIQFKCPTCRKPVERENEYFPFCSKRCKTIDLGRWAAGDYAIPGDPSDFPDIPEGYDPT